MCWITACKSSRFLPVTSELIPLDGDLNLELPILDLFDEALGHLLVDALADHGLLPHRLAGGFLDRLIVDRACVDFATRQMAL